MSTVTHGSPPWMLEDYETLTRVLRDGSVDDALAVTVGRSLTAIRSAAKRLLPPAEGTGRRRSNLLALREALIDPDYPWETHLRDSYAAEGKTLWSADTERVLIDAYQASGPPLPEIAAHLGVSQDAAARHLLARGVAPDYVTIEERLHPSPDTDAAARARLARADATTAVLVELVTSHSGRVVHVAIHPGGESPDRIIAAAASAFPGLRLTLAPRTLGENEGPLRIVDLPVADEDSHDPWAIPPDDDAEDDPWGDEQWFPPQST